MAMREVEGESCSCGSRADAAEQGAALGLLRAAAQMAQATLRQPDDVDEHLRRVSSVQRALTRLRNSLEEYGEG